MMQKIFAAIAVLLVAFALPIGSAMAAIDRDTLQRIKRATVFVSLGQQRNAGSGSGFLVHREGERGWVVTNAHVASKAVDGGLRVVFNSGTRKADSIPATVVALSRSRDLAVLEVQAPSLPEPLPIAPNARAHETQTVHIVGFPFGKGFATNRETPIITISRGTVSSQRMDVNDQARLMQIDGDLNPGNSGGPIVDDAGQVVGVAVATVRRTNIGFAIPLAPVVEMLAGTLTDLQGELSAGGVRVRAQLLDPLGRFESARLQVRAMKEDAVLDLLGDDESWQSIAPKAKSATFTRKSDDTLQAEHALPDPVAADRVLVAQITLSAKGVDRYLPPFRLKANALSLALTGPDVMPADDEGVLAEDGASDSKNSRAGGTDKVATVTGAPSALDELFTRSGLSGLITSMSTGASDDLDQAARSDDEQTVRERLREIIAAQWDEGRIKRTFVRSFEAMPNADAQRRATELFDLPAMKLLHLTNDRLAPLSAREAEALKKWHKHDPNAFNKRVELMREIDEKRQYTRTRMDALKTAISSLSRLLNEIKPANTRMSEELLKRDVERNIAQLERRVRGAVPVMLVNQYKDADEADLRDYLKQLDSIAMRWFTESEFAASAAVVKAQFSEAEDEILQLFKEVRRETLGLAEPPDLKGKSDEQAMEALMETYGKPGVIEYVLKRRGGEIHIQRGGGMKSQFGRPGQDSVNAKTMTADLKAMKLQSKAFADELAQFLVDKAYKEQRVTTNVRTARLIDALKERRRAKVLLGGKTRKAHLARKKELRAIEKEKRAQSQVCEKTCKTQRSSCYNTESTSYALCRQIAPSSGKERSRTLSVCSQQRRGKREACKAEASECSRCVASPEILPEVVKPQQSPLFRPQVPAAPAR